MSHEERPNVIASSTIRHQPRSPRNLRRKKNYFYPAAGAGAAAAAAAGGPGSGVEIWSELSPKHFASIIEPGFLLNLSLVQHEVTASIVALTNSRQ